MHVEWARSGMWKRRAPTPTVDGQITASYFAKIYDAVAKHLSFFLKTLKRDFQQLPMHSVVGGPGPRQRLR